MPRFFLSTALHVGETVTLPGDVVRHLNVLRCRIGEEIVLFNGDGLSYHAVLNSLDKRAAEAEISSIKPSENESPLHITLIQAVSSGERMDFTLQKSVELGVNEIILVESARSVVKLSGERAEKRVSRWQEIVISACEQSGRNTVPAVRPLLPFRQALQNLPDAEAKLLMSLNRSCRLNSLPPPRSVVFMVGPEGGWTEERKNGSPRKQASKPSASGGAYCAPKPPHWPPSPRCKPCGAIFSFQAASCRFPLK